MKPRVYLETTIPSYLTARSSRDLVIAAHQQVTQEWWSNRRVAFELYVSQVVIQEAGGGHDEAARKRLEVLEDLPLVDIDDEVAELGQALLADVPLPAKAAIDAIHIAAAVVSGMDYLLTWNCKHIANAALRSRIEGVCRSRGYDPPVICTPEELLEED